VELFNFSTQNRISVKRTDDNGRVAFGRFEAGEYLMEVEVSHDDEWFSFNEEIHVLSGVDVNHEMNLADQRGDILVRFLMHLPVNNWILI